MISASSIDSAGLGLRGLPLGLPLWPGFHRCFFGGLQ